VMTARKSPVTPWKRPVPPVAGLAGYPGATETWASVRTKFFHYLLHFGSVLEEGSERVGPRPYTVAPQSKSHGCFASEPCRDADRAGVTLR
jgi:hypothetical protein